MTERGRIVVAHHYYRSHLRHHPDWLFAFGDNMVERGLGGQAKECRGEPNAVGIPTKWGPSMREDAFFKDADLPKVADRINDAFNRLESHLNGGGVVVWPMGGVGTGLADLPRRAPAIFALIKRRAELLREPPDAALLADICDKMAEVVAPLPGIPDAPGQHAGTRAIEPSDGDKR